MMLSLSDKLVSKAYEILNIGLSPCYCQSETDVKRLAD